MDDRGDATVSEFMKASKWIRRCCDCGRIVWPGQQSYISASPIHSKCHRKSLQKFLKNNPDMAGEMAREMINGL